MGRYDKIKVYNNNAWRAPNRIRVYQNGWQDLGTNDSDSTKTLKVRYNNAFRRVTLNKKTTTTVTDRWATGNFKVLPANGYNSWPDNGRPFSFSIDSMEKTTSGAQVRIFNFWTSASGSYINIVWDTDGYIRAYFAYNGNVRTITSAVSYGANTRISFSLATRNNTYGAYCDMYVNGNWSGGYVNSLSYGSADNLVGDGNLKLRGALRVSGYDSGGGAHSVAIDMNTASGSNGSTYQDVPHHETTTTTVTWE